MTQKRYTEIPKRQKCINKEEPYICGAEDIVDDTLGKPQSQVNQDRIEDIAAEVQRAQGAESTLDGKIGAEKTRAEGVEGGLNTRLQIVEQLAEISVGGGDIGIGTAADFESDDPEDLAKVPTIGAMLGGANDGVYDISARHNGATYADLSAALDSNNGGGVPQSLQKGGMSVKFVQSSDNNYVQFICMSNSFTTDTTKWAICSNGVYIYNPEFIAAWTDKDKKIIIAVENDGNVLFGAGVPRQVIEYINEKIAELSLDEYEDIVTFLGNLIDGDKTLQELLNEKVDKEEGKGLIPTQYIQEIDNPEFIAVWTDKDKKILFGFKTDGDVMFGCGVPSAILKYISDYINTDNNSIRKYLDETFGLYIEDVEGRMEVKTDVNKKIIKYRDGDGRLHENIGIATNSLQLTPEGMTEFQQAMKDAGVQLGGGGDWSDRDNIELPEPKHYSLLNIVVDSLPINDSDVSIGYVEYYDGLGNYFKLNCELTAQGQTSRIFAQTGGKGNYTLDLPKDVKFGSWVPQDSFHLKGCAKDVVRGILPTSYKWAYMMQEYLGSKPNRVLIDESEITTLHATGNRMNDWPTDARCLPDGFPVEVYINGEYWGLYSWQLKKHRKNYSMDKKDYTSFFIDPDAIMTDNYQNGIWTDGPANWWTKFDIKGPKDLYCMDGSKFDGDAPQELIDSTSPYYDSSNKAHKGSQTTKRLIESFQTRYLEVKALIDNDSIEQAKIKFNENFDYLSCMLVYIYNCTMKNDDSVKKNTLWGMYKSGKIFAALWDLDSMYGEGWVGNSAVSPSATLWNNTYANSEWPLKLLWDLYEDEIKATYINLRKAAIINIDTWHNIVFSQWMNRIGEEAFNRDIEKWPETPSYRENYTNTDYWIENGIINTNSAGVALWNNETEYSVGDFVALKCHPQTAWGIRYKAVQASGSENPQCPVTQFYEGFPQIGGFFDSPKRWEKWMNEQIVKCDVKNGYFDEVVADFTAYRETDADYTINCVDMSVVDNLSNTYSFIEGHITRHEIEVDNQTVSIYTIYKGDETEEDTSKTYTTVREAIEVASQQAVDVPSEELFYIKARTRDIVFKSK